MATIRAVLNKDRVKKCGGYSLVIQILHKRVKRVIYSPYILREINFNAVTQAACYVSEGDLGHKQIKEINTYISSKKREIANIIDVISDNNKNFDTGDIILKYQMNQSDRFLVTFIEHLIEKKEQLGKPGMAKAFRSTLRSLQKYIGKRAVLFRDIDHRFVKEYESFLEFNGVKQNTVNFYIRNFRTIYNLAYDSGVESEGYGAFRRIHLKQCKTTKRALKRDVIHSIAVANLADNPALERARDLFMFSFYTRGMSFVDIIYLKNGNIIDGVIHYCRQKTHKEMEVAITPPLQALIDKYKGNEIYVLPFIAGSDLPTLYQKYQSAYKKMHIQLKTLQKKLNIPTPLTMHVARHSWASTAKEHGAPIAAISEGLGHESERTTSIYLKELDRTIIDKINEKIVYYSTPKSANKKEKELSLFKK